MLDPALGLVLLCIFLASVHKFIWEPLVLQAHFAATSTTTTFTVPAACDCSAELRKVVELQEKQERLRLELQFWWGSALIALVVIFILLGALACISCCAFKPSNRTTSPPSGNTTADLPDRLALTGGTTTVVTPAVRKAILAAAQKS